MKNQICNLEELKQLRDEGLIDLTTYNITRTDLEVRNHYIKMELEVY